MAYFVYHVSSLLVKRSWASWLLKSWTKKTSKFSNHNSKQYHKLAVTQAEALKSSHNRPE